MSGSISAGRQGDLPGGGLVASEFAEVSVRIDLEANGPRLRVEDLRTGRVRHFDPLELETLVWLPPGDLRRLLDPGAHRWREDPA